MTDEVQSLVEVDSTPAPEVTATTDTASIEPEITENSQEQVPEEKKFTQAELDAMIGKRIEAYAAAGYNICLWPSHINHKDVNDMVRGGIKPADIKLIIDNNTFSGLRAQMAISSWKKC